MMRLIGISLPRFFPGEAVALTRLFEEGMELLHLRKPGSGTEALGSLLRDIPRCYYDRIVLHDGFSLANKLSLKGIHLNSRNHEVPDGFRGTISCSCHTLQEVAKNSAYDYIFLSPLFNSISKEGYGSGFTSEALQAAAHQGIITHRVIGLGGIDKTTMPSLASLGFGGVAVLGGLWGDYETCPDLPRLLARFHALQNASMPMKQLQFVTHQTRRYTYMESAYMALQGGCRWIQLRMKDASYNDILETAVSLKTLCQQYNATFIIDDHVSIAAAVQAHGVHLGKNDMPVPEARQILGIDYLIGGTANTFTDLQQLVAEEVNYVGLGPFRFTQTKKSLSPVLGLTGYQTIIKQCMKAGIHIPFVAIGGITANDIPALVAAGVPGIALSSTILNAEDPIQETKNIIQKLQA